MTSRDFCYWLQGYFEVSGTKQLTREQGEMVQQHLSLVFKHEIDPSFGAKVQEALSTLHTPGRIPGEPLIRC